MAIELNLFNQNRSLVTLGPRGQILVGRDYVQSSNAALEYTCPTDSAQGGLMAVARNAELSGTLVIFLEDDFEPIIGYTVTLFTVTGSITGTFNSLILPDLPPAYEWDTSRLYSHGELSISVPADTDTDGMGDTWEAQYFTHYSSCDPTGDADMDGANNYAEYIAGTHPKDGASCLQLQMQPVVSGSALSWNTVMGRVYTIEWSPNLSTTPFIAIQRNLPHTETNFEDTAHGPLNGGYYRLRVELK